MARNLEELIAARMFARRPIDMREVFCSDPTCDTKFWVPDNENPPHYCAYHLHTTEGEDSDGGAATKAPHILSGADITEIVEQRVGDEVI